MWLGLVTLTLRSLLGHDHFLVETLTHPVTIMTRFTIADFFPSVASN